MTGRRGVRGGCGPCQSPAPSLIVSGLPVSEILQVLAGLEADRLAGGDGHLDAGLGIAPHALLAVAHLEDAEAAQLDPLAVAEGVLHGLDDGVDGLRRLHPGYVRDFRDAVDDVRLDHCSSEAAASLTTGLEKCQQKETPSGPGLAAVLAGEDAALHGGGGGG